MHIYTEFSHIFPFTFLIDAFHIQSKLVKSAEKITLSILLRKSGKSCIVVLLRINTISADSDKYFLPPGKLLQRAEISFSQL